MAPWTVSLWQRFQVVMLQRAAAVSVIVSPLYRVFESYVSCLPTVPGSEEALQQSIGSNHVIPLFSVLLSGAQAAPSPSKTSVTSRSTRATTSRMMPMPKMASRSSTNTRSASTKAACTAKPPTTSTASVQAADSPLPPLAR